LASRRRVIDRDCFVLSDWRPYDALMQSDLVPGSGVCRGIIVADDP
jgi:hypothetical protein